MSDTFDHELDAFERSEASEGFVGMFPTEEELLRPPMSQNDIDGYNLLSSMF